MKNKKVYIVAILVVLLVILGVSIVVDVLVPRYSPDILNITYPVKKLSGRVEAVKGDTIEVSNRGDYFDMLLPTHTPDQNKITYSITINKNTIVKSEGIFTFETPTLPSYEAIPNREVIKVGDMVTVGTSSDLRLLKKRQFEANLVIIKGIQKHTFGYVEFIDDSTLRIKANMGEVTNSSNSAGIQKEYTFALTANTGFHDITDSTRQKNQFRIDNSQIKKDMYVLINTDSDINAPKVKALRVVVIPRPGAAIPTPKATPEITMVE